MKVPEYERMISIVYEMVTIDALPVIERQIPQMDVTNQLLLFTFYVLHLKLHGKKKKDYYIQFLKKAFYQLSEYSIETIEKKYSQPPQFSPTDKWIPKIIKDQAIKR